MSDELPNPGEWGNDPCGKCENGETAGQINGVPVCQSCSDEFIGQFIEGWGDE